MSDEKKVEKYYDDVSAEYDEKRREKYISIIDEIMWSHITAVLGQVKKGRILDAGGGTGEWSIPMAKEGFDVTLVDLSEKMIQVAEKKSKEAGVFDKMTFRKANLNDLEFEDGYFDAVLCIGEVLSCIDSDLLHTVIEELARVLKSGGKMILTGANRYFFSLYFLKNSIEKSRDMLTSPTIEAPDNPKALLFSKDELEKLLEKHNICIEKVIGVGVLTLLYKEYLQEKTLGEKECEYLKELECTLGQVSGVREIAPSILVTCSKR